jgi:hypothetical protein
MSWATVIGLCAMTRADRLEVIRAHKSKNGASRGNTEFSQEHRGSASGEPLLGCQGEAASRGNNAQGGSNGAHTSQPAHLLQSGEEASPMTITVGKFYRYRNTHVRWFILHMWDDSAEVVVINGAKVESWVWPLDQLEKWLTCESVASWRDVEPIEPDPRQTDIDGRARELDFIASMMGEDG